ISRRAAYVKFLNPAARYAMVGVFAACGADGTPHIAVTGARTGGAVRLQEAGMGLIAGFVTEGFRGVRLLAEDLAEDLFADAAYRAHLAKVFARKAVALASGPAPGVMVLSHGSRAAGVPAPSAA